MDEWNFANANDGMKKEIFNWNESQPAKENNVKIVDRTRDNFKTWLLVILVGFLIGFGYLLYLSYNGNFKDTNSNNQTVTCPSLSCPITQACPKVPDCSNVCNCPNITIPSKFYLMNTT